jgi:hypothetical protein
MYARVMPQPRQGILKAHKNIQGSLNTYHIISKAKTAKQVKNLSFKLDIFFIFFLLDNF